MKSRWTTIDVPVHYVDFGGSAEGGTVVCLHGLGGSHLNWAALGPLLSGRRRVIALDLVGSGRSAGVTDRATRSAHIDDNQGLVERFLAAVAPGPVTLVGHSMGALIALRHAAWHPDDVKRLVLISPPTPLGPRSIPPASTIRAFAPYAVPAFGAARLSARRRGESAGDTVDRVVRLCCAHPERLDPVLRQQHVDLAVEREAYPHRDREFAVAAASTLRLLTRRSRYAATLRRIQAPVLVVSGARDRVTPTRAARHLAHRMGWTLAELDDVGHLPQIEAPHATGDRIISWLATSPREPLQPALRHQ